MSSKQESIKIKLEPNDGVKRRDPTTFLPEEPMSYEIKPKKKKKKKKRKESDPFGDIEDKALVTTRVIESEAEGQVDAGLLDPEVTIKVEDIEVQLDFDDFANESGFMEEDQNVECDEREVKIEPQNHEAVLLTIESTASHNDILDNIDYVSNEVPTKSESSDNHICQICHLVFGSPRTLKFHQHRKHQVFRRTFVHVCKFCGMSYDQRNSLHAHMKRRHGPGVSADDNDEKTCEVCALVFKGKNRLRMHMHRQHGYYQDSFRHVCDDCGLVYEKYSSLIIHMRRKHSKEPKKKDQWLKCIPCDKMFLNKESYARHMQRKHTSEDDRLPHTTEELIKKHKGEDGQLVCSHCPLVFSSIHFLKLHLRRKHNALSENYRLKCRICNLSYENVESLKKHVKRRHDKENFCELCNKQFSSRDAYLNHSHVRTVKECSQCGVIFSSQAGLSRHLRVTHGIESPKVVFCHICNEGFHEKRLLKPHMLKVHLKVSFNCKACSKVFTHKESYRRHLRFSCRAKHVKSELIKCEHCPNTFVNELDLCHHVNVEHQEKRPPVDSDDEHKLPIKQEDIQENFHCTKCTQTYETWNELRTHYEQNHRLTSFERTQCQLCGELVQQRDLQKHIKMNHKESEEILCRFCDFKSKDRRTMTQHTLRHKNATTLHCDYVGCKYNTYYAAAMEKHKKRHDETELLQCTHCPFRTLNKYILKYHEEAHVSGKKKHKCDQCEYTTALPANLIQHKYKHSTEKKFKCEMCPFATKYNTSLRFHVKKKHCDLPSST